jgi:hypothetical protein
MKQLHDCTEVLPLSIYLERGALTFANAMPLSFEATRSY